MEKDKETIAREQKALEDSKKLFTQLTGLDSESVKFGQTLHSDFDGNPLNIKDNIDSFNIMKRNLFNRNSINEVNFVVKLNNYTTYEFETIDTIYVDEAEDEFNLFRLFINSDGSKDIMVANDDDFDIHEDVSYLFDIDDIESFCLDSAVVDITKDYIEHYNERIKDGEDLGEMNLTPIIDLNDEIKRQYTIIIDVNDLVGVMKYLNIPITDENIEKLMKAKILEKTYSAIVQQLPDEIEFMINDSGIELNR